MCKIECSLKKLLRGDYSGNTDDAQRFNKIIIQPQANIICNAILLRLGRRYLYDEDVEQEDRNYIMVAHINTFAKNERMEGF